MRLPRPRDDGQHLFDMWSAEMSEERIIEVISLEALLLDDYLERLGLVVVSSQWEGSGLPEIRAEYSATEPQRSVNGRQVKRP